MDPTAERILWFVLGLLAGWLTAWIVGAARSSRPRAPLRPELHTAPAMPAPAPAPPREPAHVPPAALTIDVTAARAAGFNMKHSEDLAIIEGIGPRIEDLLRANGVSGFATLAALDEADLREILDRGGPSFRFANPSAWARQAQLATENRWSELKHVQRELIGDVESGAGQS